MKVIKIGGCNGSGKTSIIRELLKLSQRNPIYNDIVSTKKPSAYRLDCEFGPVYILGSYETNCGGMDTISDKDKRLYLIENFAKLYSDLLPKNRAVIFEGLITGKTYGAIGEISEREGQFGNWTYAFMDTPFDVCVQRVLERRKANGNLNPFDAERTMRSTFKGCAGAARIAGEKGHRVIQLDHKRTPAELASDVLKLAGVS